MNPDSPQTPQEEVEIRLTALLLGELSDHEAAALRRAIDQDAGMAALYDRLRHTIDMVRETTASPMAVAAPEPEPLKLSDGRRQELLAHFKTVVPREFAAPRRREIPWFVRMSAAAVLAAMIGVAVLILPNLQRARESSQRNSIENNLRIIEGAKEQWALEYRKLPGDIPTPAELSVYFKNNTLPPPVAGETYALNAAGLPVTVSEPGKPPRSTGRENSHPSSEFLTASDSITVSADGRSILPADNGVAESLKGLAKNRAVQTDLDAFERGSKTATGIPVGKSSGNGGEGEVLSLYRTRKVPPRTDTIVLPRLADESEKLREPTLRGDASVAEIGETGKQVEQIIDSKPSALPHLGDVPLVGSLFRSEAATGEPSLDRQPQTVEPEAVFDGDATTAKELKNAPDARENIALTLSARESVAGDNLSWWGADGSRVNVTNGFFYRSEQPSSADAPKDLALGFSRGEGLPRTTGERGALDTYSYHADASGFTDAAANEAVRRQLPTNIVQTPGKELALARSSAVQESEGKQKLPVVERAWPLSPIPGPKAEPGGVRASDDILTESTTLGPETVRRLMTEPSKAEKYSALETQLGQLQNLSRDELNKEIIQGRSDPVLTNLVGQSRQSEMTLAKLKQTLGGQNSDITGGEIQAADLKRQIDDRVDGIVAGLETKNQAATGQLALLERATDDAQKKEAGQRTAEKSYLADKREVENLEKVRDAIILRVLQETVDTAIPRSGVVEIVEAAKAEADPAQSRSLWRSLGSALTGASERTARIALDNDVADINPLSLAQNSTQYDPYFIQTEFEKIRSKSVLYTVIEKLNLNEKWANKEKSGTGTKLQTAETYQLLGKALDVSAVPDSKLIDIRVKSDKPDEAALIANTIAEVYRDSRLQLKRDMAARDVETLKAKLAEQEKKIALAREKLKEVRNDTGDQQSDVSPPKPVTPAPVLQPEIETRDNPFSTFSLNVSDVSFKLAAASLEKGLMPEPGAIRSEEFINAFDYRDPEPPSGAPVAFAWERAHDPFTHNRDLLRFSLKTAATGRQSGRPLNLVLLLDNSGSMERADRVRIIHEALRVLATQLGPQDKFSVVTFARTANLRADGVPGDQAGPVSEQVGNLTPQGGTNLEEAMNLGYQTAARHFLENGVNRVVLLTDGAANLGNADADALKQKVETFRRQGIALDCFGIGWEGFNDDLLEVLSRNGDGRYGFINTPGAAATDFAGQLAGALNVAAADVKVQVEFNPSRVTAYRQIGYAKHQLTTEQFRDNTVDAAEIAAAESGNALYVIEVNPAGEGPLGTVHVRFKVPGTADYREHEWTVPYTGTAPSLEQAGPAMRLAATAGEFAEWLASSPYATEVTPERLTKYLSGVPQVYGADERPRKLEGMIHQARSISGK